MNKKVACRTNAQCSKMIVKSAITSRFSLIFNFSFFTEKWGTKKSEKWKISFLHFCPFLAKFWPFLIIFQSGSNFFVFREKWKYEKNESHIRKVQCIANGQNFLCINRTVRFFLVTHHLRCQMVSDYPSDTYIEILLDKRQILLLDLLNKCQKAIVEWDSDTSPMNRKICPLFATSTIYYNSLVWKK